MILFFCKSVSIGTELNMHLYELEDCYFSRQTSWNTFSKIVNKREKATKQLFGAGRVQPMLQN
jgi:hypothetical protein